MVETSSCPRRYRQSLLHFGKQLYGIIPELWRDGISGGVPQPWRVDQQVNADNQDQEGVQPGAENEFRDSESPLGYFFSS